MSNLLIEEEQKAPQPTTPSDQRRGGTPPMRASFNTAAPGAPGSGIPPVSAWSQIKSDLGNWFQLFFTWINSVIGVRHLNGNKYTHHDFETALANYSGRSMEREDPSRFMPHETPQGAGPRLVKAGPSSTTSPADAGQTSINPPKPGEFAHVTGAVIQPATITFRAQDDVTKCDVTITKTGGSEGWRANNPGLLKESDLESMAAETKLSLDDFNKNFGVMGTDANGHVVFATIAHGVVADMVHMQKNYHQMTLADAVAEMTAGTENDAYRIFLTANLAGVDPSKKVAELKPDEFGRFVRAAADARGLQEGSITITGDGITPEARNQITSDQGGNLQVLEKPTPASEPKPAAAAAVAPVKPT